jgi:hypothetical protein
MSELNDLIASSSVHAFNSGIEQGKKLERNRILGLLQAWIDNNEGDIQIAIELLMEEK